jgi:hypothetical protein
MPSPKTDAINWQIPIVDKGTMRLNYGVDARVYFIGHVRVMITHDPTPEGLRWHMSISCSDRNPTWKEMATARYRLLPDVQEMAMFLPPLDEYVNLHPFTFHWHEVPRKIIVL